VAKKTGLHEYHTLSIAKKRLYFEKAGNCYSAHCNHLVRIIAHNVSLGKDFIHCSKLNLFWLVIPRGMNFSSFVLGLENLGAILSIIYILISLGMAHLFVL
jgi:hypothetical protein